MFYLENDFSFCSNFISSKRQIETNHALYKHLILGPRVLILAADIVLTA